MGLRQWFERVFGRSKPAGLCTLCHCDIPASDLEKGVAVVVARQTYCRGCVDEITRHAGRPANWTLSADTGSSSTVHLR